MGIKKIMVLVSFLAAMACPFTAGWAQAGKAVMYLNVSLLPDNNILRVTWEHQDGVAEYSIERWEVRGTNHWHFNINENMKPGEKFLKIGGLELEPTVFDHRISPGKTTEFYDQNVMPGYTYFYRVNDGIISVGETRARPVVPVEGEKLVQADQTQAGEQGEMGKSNSGRSERQKKYEETTDYPERMAADLIMALPNWLIRVIGLHDPLELVFGVKLKDSYRIEDDPAPKNTDLVWNMYNREEFKVTSDFYTNTRQAMPVFMAAGIVIAGMLLLFNSTSPRAAFNARGYIWGILLCAVLLKLGPYLLGFFFDVNRAIIALCHSVVIDEINQSILHSIYNEKTRSLGAGLTALIACVSVGVINFQFAVRKVFIAILVGILPVALVNAIFPGRRNALAVWVREFTSYVFMPAGLAVGLSFFIHFLNSGNFWITLVCLLFLPTINSLVRGVLGLSDSGITAGMGSALGMGALFSMGSILKGAREGNGGAPQDLSGSRETGGQGDAAVKTGKIGQRGPLGKSAPGIVGSLAGGLARAGVTGSMALAGSMVSGAASGDSAPGLEFGASAGRAVNSTIGSTGSNLSKFYSEVREKGFTEAAGVVDSSMLMDPGVTASLANRMLGGSAVGNTAAAIAATSSRAVRAISPLAAPEARERLDRVTELMEERLGDNGKQFSEADQRADLSREFQKMRQAQHFRGMFRKIQSSRHSGGTGGIDGFNWR